MRPGVALQAVDLRGFRKDLTQDFAEEILKDLGVSKKIYDSINSGSGILLCHNMPQHFLGHDAIPIVIACYFWGVTFMGWMD